MLMWDVDDLLGVREIAGRFGIGRAAVSNWPRRYDDFPRPIKTLAMGPLYSWRQIIEWHGRNISVVRR